MSRADDDISAARREAYAVHRALLATLDGAASLIAQHGEVPSFHDATLEDLQLSVRGRSRIRLANPYPTIFDRGRLFITFEIETVLDLQLDLFGHTVLSGLLLSPAVTQPERKAYLPRQAVEGDIRFSIEASVGMSGSIVGRGVSVRWSKDRRARAG